jgi:hypothetical protein
MQILAITPMVQGIGQIPNGIVVYKRDHPFHPFVVHNYADNRSFNDGTALSLFQGTYVGRMEDALDEFERRAKLRGRVAAEGPSFVEAVHAVAELGALDGEAVS